MTLNVFELTTIRIWTSEVFSMNVRAQAVGMAAQSQNIANAILGQFFPIFLTNCGFYAFYMFAGINFLLAAFVFFFIPETKKVKLEEIDTLFGGANHIEKGANMLALDAELPPRDGGRQAVGEVTEITGSGMKHNDKSAVSQVEHMKN